jgi:predicted AAA+ superfamily ATPase
MREVVRQKIADSLARDVPAFTRRDLRAPSLPGKAVSVIGMRRSGKTTYLWQLLADRMAAGADRADLLFFGFEDERLVGMAARDLDLIVDEYYKARPSARGTRTVTLFLDEIQVVSGWELFIRRLLDTERMAIIVSGSSAKLLSREVATSLRGRSMEAVVFPFSFREALRHAGVEPAEPPERWTSAVHSQLGASLRDYLVVGGFPEAQGLDAVDRFELLRGHVDTVLLRDIIERHTVSNPVALRWMVRHLLSNTASSFSIHRLHGDLTSQGLKVGKDSLHAYLGHLEDSFLLRLVSVDTDSERRRMTNPRKAYPVDPGFIPVFDRSGKANVGHALETCVLVELERRRAEVTYAKLGDGSEIDFVARYPDGRVELIQVCADMASRATAERETGALAAARAEYPDADRLVIVAEPPPAPIRVPGIRIATAEEWLLRAG